MKEEYVTYTSTTYRQLTREECVNEILHHSDKLVNKKWWEDKSYHKRRIQLYLDEINKGIM
jgi:hypothetical protein